jgi:hypothetical protein
LQVRIPEEKLPESFYSGYGLKPGVSLPDDHGLKAVAIKVS